MFKPQFAPLVESGAKCQTVRPVPKRMPKAGDPISLRAWTGLPYRSKQRVLREAKLEAVKRITIHETFFWHEGNEHFAGAPITNPSALEEFAKADGFGSWAELVAWFKATHALPFHGIALYWK